MKKILIALLLCALSLSAASGLAEGKLEAIQAAGKLVMGTDAAWPPFEYIGANGEPDGSRATACEINRDKKIVWAWFPKSDANMMSAFRID